MKLLSTNILYALASSPPQCQQALTSTTTGSFISQKEFMPVLRGKVNLKADYDSSLDGSPLNTWKNYGIYSSSMPGTWLGKDWSHHCIGRTATRVLLSGMKTGESSEADPTHGSAFISICW